MGANCLQDLREIDNLKRAWRWIRSNPEAQYKSYFRILYSAYAVCSDEFLKDLSNRLKRNIYTPSPACKIFLPKPSGVLRPYTLLTVEDQIVYQAAINIIAERFIKRVRGNYYKEIFAHLYAGKASIWFYRKWSKGYQAFNEACRETFNRGFQYTASFDLTACYDSVDHGVLKYFLRDCGCDEPFCLALTSWLSNWTSTDQTIFHNHGIPQGPLSSGLLSELVLHYFDNNRGKPKRVRYLRYVDDIRLFAKSELDLRRMLIKLDLLSKDIGLFPQTSKIEIQKVSDIEKELKSVSCPPEDAIKLKVVDQKKLRLRIKTLSKGFKITNLTRFKFLLAHATPHSTITNRIWHIYRKHLELYPIIVRYLQRYTKFPQSVSREILKRLKEAPIYPAVTAAFIETINKRIEGRHKTEALDKVAKMWQPNRMQDDLLVAAGRLLLVENKLTYDQISKICTGSCSWWGRSQLILVLPKEYIGNPSFSSLINKVLRDSCMDVALAAALRALNENVSISKPIICINRNAKMMLKKGGAIRRGAGAVCGISLSIRRMVGSVSDVNWHLFFGMDYRKAEKQIVCIAAYNETDVTSWVNAMDVFNDWLLNALHRNDTSIGQYKLGDLGGSLNNRKRKIKYPAVSALAKGIHDRRYQSNLSHAIQRYSGKATGPISWDYFKTGRKLLKGAVYELAQTWG